MKRAQVFRLSMAHPGDLSALEKLIVGGTIRAADVVAIIGKTEGNGGVNDFTRGYATLSLKLLLAESLRCAPSEIDKRVAIVMSGGTEGGLSPHLLVFSREPAAAPAPSRQKRCWQAACSTIWGRSSRCACTGSVRMWSASRRRTA